MAYWFGVKKVKITSVPNTIFTLMHYAVTFCAELHPKALLPMQARNATRRTKHFSDGLTRSCLGHVTSLAHGKADVEGKAMMMAMLHAQVMLRLVAVGAHIPVALDALVRGDCADTVVRTGLAGLDLVIKK